MGTARMLSQFTWALALLVAFTAGGTAWGQTETPSSDAGRTPPRPETDPTPAEQPEPPQPSAENERPQPQEGGRSQDEQPEGGASADQPQRGTAGNDPQPEDQQAAGSQENAAGEDPQANGAESIPEGQELVNIDFPEPTDIRDIIKAVSLWTGKNVILDRNVNGKVQIISPKKVTKEEAYQAFLSALNILGLTTVETGKVIKIMPVRNAVKGNLKTFLGSSWTPLTDEIITQIVPLKYIDAEEIRRTLSRIVNSRSMIAYEPTNTLIISDSGYNVRRILDIIELLDVEGQQAQLAIVPIRYAEAKKIADKVEEIFEETGGVPGRGGGGGGDDKGGRGSRGGGESYGSYKILVDERTNSVVIYGPPRTISDVKSLVKRFDVPLDDPSTQATIHVRPLDFADAKKLASTLSNLASGGDQQRRRIRRPPIRRRDRDDDDDDERRRSERDEPAAVAKLDDNVKITADESSNSLLITGSHSAYQALNTLIRKLDVRRSQVFVESDILDINLDGQFGFKSHVFGGGPGPKNSAVATTWEAGPMGPLIAAQATDNDPSKSSIEDSAKVFSEDLTVGLLSGKEVEIKGLGSFRPGALIRLIKTDGNTQVLASPHIMTANNEEAEISAGEKIFFRTEETNPQSGAVVNKVEKEDVDLTLSLKPNISHANYVTLEIELESNSATVDADTGLPKVNKRKTQQKVTVKTGQTVVISGLVQTRKSQRFEKIPLLGDIPLLGWLFRNSTVQSSRNNLMIFLTPHIIHGADDLAAVYKAKVEERNQFLRNIYGDGYQNDSFYAQLPDLEDGTYKPDPIDKRVRRAREQRLERMYDKAEGGASDEEAGAKEGESIYLPMNGGDRGGGDGDFDDGDSPGGSRRPDEPESRPEPRPDPGDSPEPAAPSPRGGGGDGGPDEG